MFFLRKNFKKLASCGSNESQGEVGTCPDRSFGASGLDYGYDSGQKLNDTLLPTQSLARD